MNTNKKIMSSIAAIVLVVSVVMGSFAFKANKTTVAPSNGWYTITTPSGDPNLESNQIIGSLTTAPPATDTFGCAQAGNNGNVCRVQLTFANSATTVPTNIEAARLSGSLTTVGTKAKSPKL